MPLRVPTYTTDDLRAFPRDGQRYELVQGTLLVTPAPSSLHQVLIIRLVEALRHYLPEPGPAWVVSPGEIEVKPRILMDPDILVYPASFPIGTAWTAITGWWLAVEVYSPSSRVYDHDFKRPAYLALGVAERLQEPLGTIKTRMRLGMQKLRETLRPYYFEGAV